MKANSFLNSITENLTAKILCFVAAIILYLFYQTGLVKSQILVIPLSIEQNGGVELVEPLQSTIRVYVRTKENVSIHQDDIQASVSLSNLTQSGVYDLPVFITLSEDAMAIDPLEVKLRQDTVKAHVEKTVSGAAFVQPEVLGSVAHGYEVKEVSVDPTLVQIMGPESVVTSENVFKTEAVSLNNLTGDKNFLVRLQKTNKRISYEESQSYLVSVKVEPVITEKIISGVKPYFINIPDNLEIEPAAESITLKVSGPLLILEKFTAASCMFNINLGNILEAGEYEFPADVSVPSSLSILENSHETFKVKLVPVQKESSESEETDSGTE